MEEINLTVKVTVAATVGSQRAGLVELIDSYGAFGVFALLLVVVVFGGVAGILMWDLWKEKKMFALVACVGVVVLVVVLAVDLLNNQVYVQLGKITLANLFSSFVALIALWFAGTRTSNNSKQIQLQIDKGIDDEFFSAVKLLNSSETSARTGAIYCLYNHAKKHENYCKEVVQILCSHIRSKTKEKEYLNEHAKIPSNEIQTVINLLFRDVNGLKGLYKIKKISSVLPRPNLSHSHLTGANFYKGNCQRVIFSHSLLHGASFCLAQCQSADFAKSKCIGVKFDKAKLQCANFISAMCQVATFKQARCQGAIFDLALCQKAIFTKAFCHGSCFYKTQLQRAVFNGANFNGVNSRKISITSFPLPIWRTTRMLYRRIGKPTDVSTVIFGGELDVAFYNAIDEGKQFISDAKQAEIEKIINSDKIPKIAADDVINAEVLNSLNIITGILKNDKKMSEVINKLNDMGKIEREQHIQRNYDA